MSILLVEPDADWGRAILEQLLEQGDEVRVLTANPGLWKDKGAYIAAGDPLDTDLVERACTNVRTVVMTFTSRKVQLSLVTAILEPAAKAGTGRVIVCVASGDPDLVKALEGSGMSYVVLIAGRRGFLPRTAADPNAVAEAVDAADDLAGDPELIVDLTSESGRRELRLV